MRPEPFQHDAPDLPCVLIDIERLVPDPGQPRTCFQRIPELAESIGRYGLIKPLLVAPYTKDQFLIVAGGRRYLALKMLQGTGRYLRPIPCCVADCSRSQLLHLALVENVQREDLSLWDAGRSFDLMNENGATVREIADNIGKSLGYVSNCLLCWRGLAPSIRAKLELASGGLAVRDILKLASLTNSFGEPDEEAQERALTLRLNYSSGSTRKTFVRRRREVEKTERDMVWHRYVGLRDGRHSTSHLTGAEKEFLTNVLAFLAGELRQITKRTYIP